MAYDVNVPLATNTIAADLAAMNANFSVLGIYRTIYTPARLFIPSVTNGCAAYAEGEFATNDVNVAQCAFDGATDEFACFQVQFPQEWDLGTVKAKVYWGPAVGASAADTVQFALQARAASDGDDQDQAYGTAQSMADVVQTAQYLHITPASAAITIAGTPAANDLINFRLYRDVSEDNMTEDAAVYGVLIQYSINVAVSAW
jgi:hypothetical protein